MAQACLEYKIKNLQVSNHSLHAEAFLCCLLQGSCPTVTALVARKFFLPSVYMEELVEPIKYPMWSSAFPRLPCTWGEVM